MDKNEKKGNKRPQSKKKQPLKVVYITNPIKFNTSASEFRALVQELTGQDADVPETSQFAAAGGGGVAKVAAERNVHAVEEVAKVGHTGEGEVGQNGSNLSMFGSCDDEDVDDFYDPQMMGSSLGFAASNMMWHEDANLDVFKGLGAM